MRSAVDRAERYFCVRVSGFRIRRKPPGDVHRQQAVVQCGKCVPGYFSAVPQAGRPGFPGILIRHDSPLQRVFRRDPVLFHRHAAQAVQRGGKEVPGRRIQRFHSQERRQHHIGRLVDLISETDIVVHPVFAFSDIDHHGAFRPLHHIIYAAVGHLAGRSGRHVQGQRPGWPEQSPLFQVFLRGFLHVDSQAKILRGAFQPVNAHIIRGIQDRCGHLPVGRDVPVLNAAPQPPVCDWFPVRAGNRNPVQQYGKNLRLVHRMQDFR